MNESQTATAARYPVKIGNVELLMSPMSDKDISEIDNWLRATYLANARASLNGETNQALRNETIAVASKEAMTISLFSEHGKRMLGTVDGMARLLWQSVHRNHPTVTYEELRAQLFDPSNLNAVNEAFNKANNSGEGKNHKSKRQTKKKAKR